jgi:hypothetical protein
MNAVCLGHPLGHLLRRIVPAAQRPLACVALALPLALGGCEGGRDAPEAPGTAAVQTGAAGTITAGGGTSGEVIAASKAQGPAPREEGTPGIPRGAEGNVGGTQLGGTVDHETSMSGSGEKTPAQAAKGAPQKPVESAPPSPAAR